MGTLGCLIMQARSGTFLAFCLLRPSIPSLPVSFLALFVCLGSEYACSSERVISRPILPVYIPY